MRTFTQDSEICNYPTKNPYLHMVLELLIDNKLPKYSKIKNYQKQHLSEKYPSDLIIMSLINLITTKTHPGKSGPLNVTPLTWGPNLTTTIDLIQTLIPWKPINLENTNHNKLESDLNLDSLMTLNDKEPLLVHNMILHLDMIFLTHKNFPLGSKEIQLAHLLQYH